jgi:hypothetical protein
MTYAQHANKYRVGERTIKRWAAKGAPLGDDAAMVEWSKAQTNLPTGFLEWLDEQKRGLAPKDGGAPTTESDWQEFEKIARTDDPKDAMQKIAKARDFAAFMLEKAWKSESTKDQKHFADLLAKMESCLHDAQLRAKKLGVDSGELLPRPECERILWALAHWLLRSTDQHLDAITAKLTALSPGLAATPVRSVLEPELLSQRFLVPFAHAAKIQNGVGLPGWVVAKMREAAGDFLENGEKQFEEISK